MARTGALQDVETTGPKFPAVKTRSPRRPFHAREDDFLMRRYCVDLGPKECSNALRRAWETVKKRAMELGIDSRRDSWKRSTYSLKGWKKEAAERLGVIEKPSVVQPYRPEFMSGPSWVGFESKPSTRSGADDHAAHPSLIGGKRVWPDGRVEVA